MHRYKKACHADGMINDLLEVNFEDHKLTDDHFVKIEILAKDEPVADTLLLEIIGSIRRAIYGGL